MKRRNPISVRCLKALNLEQYNKPNKPMEVGSVDLTPPQERQYILRMLIKRPFEELALPPELEWCRPMVEKAFENQAKLGLIQPFCYITVRHGLVTSQKDDEWHVDGFSMNITHLPEQNYVWASNSPTEYIAKDFKMPKDFSPKHHNIHWFLQDSINSTDEIKTCKPKTLYCMDTYVVHRRPSITQDMQRTFVRLSFTPIEISDVNNTFNSLMPTNYKRDGIVEFREKLQRYPVKNL